MTLVRASCTTRPCFPIALANFSAGTQLAMNIGGLNMGIPGAYMRTIPFTRHMVLERQRPLNFKVAGPSVTLYGIKLAQFGAQAFITLDLDVPVLIDSNVTDLPNGASLATQQILFSKSGLDPSAAHKITVAYDDSAFDPSKRAWLSIDFFEVDEPPNSATPSSPSSLGAPTASLGQSPGSPGASVNTKSSVNVGAIVGGVLGGLAGVLVGLLLLARRWRRQRALRSGAVPQLSPLVAMAATTPDMAHSDAGGHFPRCTSYAPALATESLSSAGFSRIFIHSSTFLWHHILPVVRECLKCPTLEALGVAVGNTIDDCDCYNCVGTGQSHFKVRPVLYHTDAVLDGIAGSVFGTGTSVAWYGIKLVQHGAQALVTVDFDAPVRVDCNVTALPDGASLRTQQLLFSKSGLDPSVPHKIVVAYDTDTSDGNFAWLSIDYFEVDEPPQGSPVPIIVTQGATPSPRLDPTPTSSAGTPTGSSDPSSGSPFSGTDRSGVSVGIIVGSVLGGCAAVILAGLLALLTRRWLRQQSLRRDASQQSVSPLITIAETPPITDSLHVPTFFQPTSYAPSSTSGSLHSIGEPSLTLLYQKSPPPYSPSARMAADTRKG
ncbi:hypothetical protein AURDEDRAFT_129968 [Auricularia subglabra TFB-10046 SS5]|nr:hypothetical protein AURDEDRAFT_129968 [Auricularia subglabra TFB-10046 SS5]